MRDRAQGMGKHTASRVLRVPMVLALGMVLATGAVADAARTWLVRDINPTGWSNPTDFVKIGNWVLFSAVDRTHGRELWRTDGTQAGTRLVRDINPSGSSHPSELITVGTTVYFVAGDGTHGRELWRSNGT